MMDENIISVNLLDLFYDFNEQLVGGGGGDGNDDGRYNCNLMALFEDDDDDDDDYGNTDLTSLYQSSETFTSLDPLTYSLESRVLQNLKLHTNDMISIFLI